MLLLLSLLVVFKCLAQPTSASHRTYVNCTKDNACKSSSLSCSSNSIPCWIYCGGTASCRGATVTCPTSANCYLECKGLNSCTQLEILGPSSGDDLRCGTSLNITLSGPSSGKFLYVNAPNTDYLNIGVSHNLALWSPTVDHSNGKSTYIKADRIYSTSTFTNYTANKQVWPKILQGEYIAPKYGEFTLVADQGVETSELDKTFNATATVYEPRINANEADNVTVTCAQHACYGASVDGRSVGNKVEINLEGTKAWQNGDVQCSNVTENPNNTRSCIINGNKNSNAMFGAYVNAVRGLIDATFDCGKADECFVNTWVYCTINYTQDKPCAVVPSVTYSTEKIGRITAVEWYCDNDKLYANSSEFCGEFDECEGIDCDTYGILQSDLSVVAWIQNNDNGMWVQVVLWGSVVVLCVFFKCNYENLKVDYPKYREWVRIRKEIRKKQKAVAAEHMEMEKLKKEAEEKK